MFEKPLWAVCALCALAVFVPGLSPASAQDVVLFQDDFEDNSMDSSKWASTSGYSVTEADGMMKVETNSTDNGGVLYSIDIPLDNSTGLITMTRRMLVHEDFSGSKYFRGRHRLLESNDSACLEVLYYDYSGTKVGFGDEYNGYAPIYDTWFDEVVTYDPVTGNASYSINGQTAVPVNFSNPLDGDTIQLKCYDEHWFTGHYINMDSITITQTPEPATLGLLAVGALAALRRRRRSA